MNRYTLSGSPPHGWRQTLFVQADSCDLAVKQLSDQGWTNILLHTDEVQAAFDKAFPAQGTALQIYYGIRGGWNSYFYQVYFIYQKCWLILVLCLASFVYYQRMDFLFWERLVLCLFPFFLPGILSLALPVCWMARRLDKVLTDEVYGRWDSMLKGVSKLGPPVKDVQKYYLNALALSGLKRMDEAETELEKLQQKNQLSEWLVLMLRVAVYLNDKDFKRADALLEKIKELSPGNVSVLLTQGVRYYLVNQNVQFATARVKEALTHTIPDLLFPHLYFLQGAIALEGRQFDDASRYLKQAEQATQALSSMPTMKLTMAIIRAHQALLWSMQGDHVRASRAFAYARPVLEGRDSQLLLDRCRKELGVI